MSSPSKLGTIGNRAGAPLARGFPPLPARRARALVLGSMPGRASIEAAEYYAHPRNAFWPIMGRLLGFDPEAPYKERCRALGRGGVALWDVLRACHREGSLDSAIRPDTEEANDFGSFFGSHPEIRAVLFNGRKAEAAFRRRVVPGLPAALTARLRFQALPSTSPAHAGMRFEEKLAAWRQGLAGLLETNPPGET